MMGNKGKKTGEDAQMYSVLIVDDFAIDRQNLADAVRSFNKLPLHIIGVCENAYDALEIIRNMETDF